MTEILFRRRELELLGTPDSSIRKALSSGSLVRVCAGAYADATAWYALDDMGRHRMRVVATAERLTTTPVFSHFAAAALWGIRILGEWPTLVDVTLDRATGGRSDGGLRRRCTGLENVDVVELGFSLSRTEWSLSTAGCTGVDPRPHAPWSPALRAPSQRRRVGTDSDARLPPLTSLLRFPIRWRSRTAGCGFSCSASRDPRENEIRRQVRMFSRWEPAELYPPRRLYDRLVRDGLPSSRRRP